MSGVEQEPTEQDAAAHDADEYEDDATVVVPHLDDATIAVPHEDGNEYGNEDGNEYDDRTVVAAGAGTGTGSWTSTGTGTAAGTATSTGTEGEPVIIAGTEVPSNLAKLLFKKPLDPKRRVPEAPFPKTQSSLPRGGVRSGIPVVYGANSEASAQQPSGTDFARWIGPPPMGYELPIADRDALPSTALANRRFRLAALIGGAAVLVVSGVGLWWVVAQLVSPG